MVPPLAPDAVVAAPADVLAPDAVVVAGDTVVLLESLLSPPHAAATSEAPSSTIAALAVLFKLVTSWVRDGERGRDAACRPDNLPHREHPRHGWVTGTASSIPGIPSR